MAEMSRRVRRYRGVAPKNGLWQCLVISNISGVLDLGLYDTEEAAARAYDRALLQKARRKKTAVDPSLLNFPEDATAEADEVRRRPPRRPARRAPPSLTAQTPPAPIFPAGAQHRG